MRNAVFLANEQLTGAVSGPSEMPRRAPAPGKREPGHDPWSDAMRISLSAQLKSHVPADAAEARSQREILEFLSSALEPFNRTTLPGHITGSAIVMTPEVPEFLLVKHRKLNRWLQPGGHVQKRDESVLATAVRETAEETGHAACITPGRHRILQVDVHEIPPRPEEPAHLHYDIRYLLTATRNTPRVELAEVMEAQWFTETAIEGLDLDASLRSAIASAMNIWIDRAPNP